uniref:Reverse transcriptase domain-containing protein n=1 Tax=Tanacetum cinerariifolium TaxID=118510 RepID=A0A6L2MWG6_TANCI|nr:reverse transcriptase domain-containing protein [Tanacetum cinerariifolium]
MKKRPQTEAQAQKNMMMYLLNTVGFRLDYFKGMSYDDICPIFEAKFNSNIEFLLKSKEQMEEEENRAIASINETPAQKAAKKRRLNEEAEDVEELKLHLEIVLDEDDDVYTEATPLARKVPVVDYQIVHFNNKPHYKIIRADGTHQLYPNNFSDDYLLSTLRAMFKRQDGQDQVWMSQRSVHGQARVKSWKLLESCGVHIITLTTTQLILLVERRYLLLRFTLNQMLNTVRLQVEEQSEMSLGLLSEELSTARHKLMLLNSAAEKNDVAMSSKHQTKLLKLIYKLQLIKDKLKSKDREVQLKLVLELLKKEKLFAKFSKGEFLLQEVHFFRHVVNKTGIHVNPSKIPSSEEIPKTPPKIRSFLGLAGKANVVVDALSRKEECASRNAAWHGPINEMKKDGGLYFMDHIWVPLVGSIWKLIRVETRASMYLVHPGANKTYYDLRALYERECWSPVMWAEITESRLIGPELVQDTTDKVVFIKEKLKAVRDHQKSYADNRRKPLEFEVEDRV